MGEPDIAGVVADEVSPNKIAADDRLAAELVAVAERFEDHIDVSMENVTGIIEEGVHEEGELTLNSRVLTRLQTQAKRIEEDKRQ